MNRTILRLNGFRTGFHSIARRNSAFGCCSNLKTGRFATFILKIRNFADCDYPNVFKYEFGTKIAALNKFLFHIDLRYRISRHLVFFALIVLIFTLVLYVTNSGERFGYLLFVTVVNAFIFWAYAYLVLFLLIPVFLHKRRFFWFGVSLAGLGFALSAIKLSVSGFIFYSSISPEFNGPEGMLNLRYILINTKDMSFIVALFVIARFTRDWLIAQNQNKELQKTYLEMNLKLLQSRFEPHFLFNTMNNLYALSLKSPQKTLDVIRKLKQVLQFAISDAQSEKVLLSKEFEMIENFMQIEQIRYGSRLRIRSSVTGNYENLLIAPFLLYSLVENCFRHGSATDAGRPWIAISLNCENSKVSFETRNSVPKKCQTVSPVQEKGLSNLRQRLDMVYPNRYSLLLREDLAEFSAKLELDLN